MKRSSSSKPLALRSASRSMVLAAAFAFLARRAETKKTGGVRPSIERMPPSTKERTCSLPSSSARRSALLMIRSIFLPQSRISSRYPRSLSVSGRSAEVTKRTRSLLGTKPRLSSSWWRMIAFVPGVSTMAISRRKALGYPFSITPSRLSLWAGSGLWRRTVMRSVVGVTPSSEISAPSKAFMNADFPELNSPTTTSRKSSSRSESALRTSSTSSVGAPKSWRKLANLSSSARSRSTRASLRSSRILIYYPPFSAHYIARSASSVSRRPRGGKRVDAFRSGEADGGLRALQEVGQDGTGGLGGRLRGVGDRQEPVARRRGRRVPEGLEPGDRPWPELYRHGPLIRGGPQRGARRAGGQREGR